jgi:hypothetical protein
MLEFLVEAVLWLVKSFRMWLYFSLIYLYMLPKGFNPPNGIYLYNRL